MRVDTVWRGARLATMVPGTTLYGAIDDGVVASRDARIVYVGEAADAPAFDAEQHIDVDGRWITPGLIDCHTHLVFGGNRAAEFEQRLEGASYEAIARAGGGIVSTVNATRAASESMLLEQAIPRLDALLAEGVTTVEIKSGYGLDAENEIKMLRVARTLAERRRVGVRTSFLGAHALPPPDDVGQRPDANHYIDDVCTAQLPQAHAEGLVDAVDGFCERIAFSADQIERVFRVAARLSLPVKLHAEQLSNSGGARLAARYGALSADHLEYVDDHGVAAMARAGTVAVLLPGAFYYLRETQAPPVEALRVADVPIAIATDLNPGSSPLNSPLLAMNMACTLFQLTPEEALAGTTRNAARALGLADSAGTLSPGNWCDLAIWDIEHPAELAYHVGFNPLHTRVYRGND